MNKFRLTVFILGSILTLAIIIAFTNEPVCKELNGPFHNFGYETYCRKY